MNAKALPKILILETVAACLLLVACGENKTGAGPEPAASAVGTATGASAPTSGGRAAGAPVSVSTVVARKRDFDIHIEAIGTVTPAASVDVKPQINSVVTKVHIKEGQFVKAGELLFTLDPRPDEANVAKVRAQMAKDEAVLADAQRQLLRSRDLLAKNFISQGALDTSAAQVDAQLANLVADKAALDAAQLALSYNSVRASGAGRLGAVNVFPGTAVQANQTLLVTITQLDPINISFSLPQRNLDTVLQGLKSGGMVVSAKLPDLKDDIKGRLQFVDNVVDAATGTIKVKARFDNRDSKLWPGAFVKTNLLSDTLKDAVVIPTAAVIQTVRGSIVYVADKGKAGLRPVKVLASQGDESVVSGISAGDKVVLEGRQNLRPDTALVERKLAPAGSASAARSPASTASAAP
ncbi:MAG TPA: efflux RND transporter periplasmic adaptor subunit [Rhodoferax sp.]|jgi:RND family efflux transporter MFP subunit|nr:efflux RND transporter periplasmic adaptor subunit [Rhodoferax sp.]HPW29163.1 efflux RND transporter periplasmic adaptor subunit [Rhodoferax sp.]